MLDNESNPGHRDLVAAWSKGLEQIGVTLALNEQGDQYCLELLTQSNYYFLYPHACVDDAISANAVLPVTGESLAAISFLLLAYKAGVLRASRDDDERSRICAVLDEVIENIDVAWMEGEDLEEW